MNKLTTAAAASVVSLLQDHQTLCEAEKRIGKKGFDAGLTISHDTDSHEFVSVTISDRHARNAISEQKALIAKDLAKHGIKVA